MLLCCFSAASLLLVLFLLDSSTMTTVLLHNSEACLIMAGDLLAAAMSAIIHALSPAIAVLVDKYWPLSDEHPFKLAWCKLTAMALNVAGST